MRQFMPTWCSPLIGARIEELRALLWSEVDLDGKPGARIPPSVAVWRSVRAMATPKPRNRGGLSHSRRDAFRHSVSRRCGNNASEPRLASGGPTMTWCSPPGTELDAHNVRRAFRQVVAKAGINGKDWTPREMRHSFVSLLSSDGVPLEVIARLVGHSGTAVTETVYRKQIRPVLLSGAEAMDHIFREM